ncbi:MAG: TolC family protein, partial [Planctomycetota bacterium]
MFGPKSSYLCHLILVTLTLIQLSGCRSNQNAEIHLGCDPDDLFPSCDSVTFLSEPEDPCIEDCSPVDTTLSPLEVSDYKNIQYTEMTLSDCISNALQNSKVFRDLGGTIISSPGAIDGVYDPATVTTDPQFSEEAALSAFDANFSAAAFFQNNDQASNLTFQGNNGIFEQDFHDYRYSLQKLSATGTIFTLSNFLNYDNSNQTGQTLSHSWQTIFQGEFRHPLLQGSGATFNRIAGPSTQPGIYNGVLIARTNTEISLSSFREAVRDLVSEVENAYWDLYFAYRNLEATIDGRDKAYEILVATTEGKSREGSQAQAQAKEQYLRFEADVLDAMEGRPTFGTRNNNGMSGGIFLSPSGVRVAERRLRLICGLPINSAELIRTSEEPAATGVQFDWHQSVNQAIHQRQELVQQKWLIKQRELQLVASKNFLRPRLDVIGQYRFRGIGRSLTGGSNSFNEDLANNSNVSTAFGDLYSGDFQEWQVGAEFSMPVGFRAAHLGVRNAELELARERAVYQEQKREVVFGLSNAFGELRRTFAALKAAEEQFVAAKEFQFVMKLEVERGRDRDIELEAQRRVVDSEVAYRQAQVEYTLALKNIHFEKGTYLDYCNVALTESQSDPKAVLDATERARRRHGDISYVIDSPTIAQPLPSIPDVSVDIEAGEFIELDTTSPIENAPLPTTESTTEGFESPIVTAPNLSETTMVPTGNQESTSPGSLPAYRHDLPIQHRPVSSPTFKLTPTTLAAPKVEPTYKEPVFETLNPGTLQP